MSSVVINGDTSGSVTLSAPAVAGTTTLTLPTTSGTILTTGSSTGVNGSAISSGTVAEAYGGTGTNTGYYGFKNRIINGAQVINQRATTITDYGYATDRWSYNPAAASKASVAQSSTAPTGFNNSLLVTSSAATTVGATDVYIIEQKIEGYNIADLGFGAAGASSVTISFWVRSSLTGTFGGALGNAGPDRSYPFTYTISSANTWEQKTVTIAGDTTGTWATTNGSGFRVIFSLGCGSSRSGTAGAWTGTSNIFSATGATSVVGTNGATFYITGVQLEKGSTATSFDYRPYGTELQLCTRYFFKYYMTTFGLNGFNENSSGFMGAWNFGFIMRVAPTLGTTGTASDYSIRTPGALTVCSAVPTLDQGSTNSARLSGSTSGGLTAGQGSILYSTTSQYLTLSAEL